MPAVQAGTGVRITVSQITDLVTGISLLSIFSEQLTVTATDTLASLSHPVAAAFSMLVVNGQVFMPVGSSPAYSISGMTITWLIGSTYSLNPGDTVIAVYTIS